jgi:hypothetical protein
MTTRPQSLEKHLCECGAMVSSKGMMMHMIGKKHLAGVAKLAADADPAADVVVEADVPEEGPGPVTTGDQDLDAILRSAERGEDPLVLAKLLRQIYRLRKWPDASHPETVVEFLAAHNIPIRTLPRLMEPGDVVIWEQAWERELREQGYGTPAWRIT